MDPSPDGLAYSLCASLACGCALDTECGGIGEEEKARVEGMAREVLPGEVAAWVEKALTRVLKSAQTS